MSLDTIYVAGIATSLLTSFSAIFYLRNQLNTILTELCGKTTRAAYWLKITNVWLVLAPLSLVMLRKPRISNQYIYEIGKYFGLTIFGILTTLFIVSVVIMAFLPKIFPASKEI